MAHRLAPEAEVDLLEIWLYIAVESGNPEIADRFIDLLVEHFLMLAKNPHIGRSRDHDLQAGLRSFPSGNYVIFYRIHSSDVLILRVIHGHRDIGSILEE